MFINENLNADILSLNISTPQWFSLLRTCIDFLKISTSTDALHTGCTDTVARIIEGVLFSHI